MTKKTSRKRFANLLKMKTSVSKRNFVTCLTDAVCSFPGKDWIYNLLGIKANNQKKSGQDR